MALDLPIEPNHRERDTCMVGQGVHRVKDTGMVGQGVHRGGWGVHRLRDTGMVGGVCIELGIQVWWVGCTQSEGYRYGGAGCT